MAIERLGKYEIIEELGRGGFATVYRALDTTLEREVALKVLDPLLMRDEHWVARFHDEARAVARLRHPRIVTIHEIGEGGGRLYIAMELIEGGGLDRLIAERGGLGWDQTLDMLAQVADALDHAHGQGILHRDLKPSNILLDPQVGAVLTDFGFARLVSGSSLSVSLSGGVIGTPQYIAPEVWENQTPGRAGDVYALGCVLFEMLTGETLFEGNNTPAVMRAHFKPLALPEAWPEGVPEGVSGVLQRALAQEPAERYQSAGELVGALGTLTIDELAEPYELLEAAVASARWDEAIGLATEIRAQDPGYCDVAGLEERALRGREAAARSEQAAMWREEAEHALAEGDRTGARVAVQHWLEMAPEDAQAEALLARLRAVEDAGAALTSSPEPQAVAPAAALLIPMMGEEKGEIPPEAGVGARTSPGAKMRSLPLWVWLVGAAAGIIGVAILATVFVVLPRLRSRPSPVLTDVPATVEVGAVAVEATKVVTATVSATEAALEEAGSLGFTLDSPADGATIPAGPVQFLWAWSGPAPDAAVEFAVNSDQGELCRAGPDAVTCEGVVQKGVDYEWWVEYVAGGLRAHESDHRLLQVAAAAGGNSLGDTWTRPPDGTVMVYVPSGEFQMGSENGDSFEQPVHTVALDGFWIDQTEVTNDQYRDCVEAGECDAPLTCDWGGPTYANGSKADHPVVCVDWPDAEAYCEWAGGRLPTEAEWEYAARGPDANIYPWGADFNCARGNFDDETEIDDYVVPGGAGCDGYNETAPVGSFPQGTSWCGALDMAGNVWEWAWDWYDEEYYATSPLRDPQGPSSGTIRIVRGGSWDVGPNFPRGALRVGGSPDDSGNDLGFRCARGS